MCPLVFERLVNSTVKKLVELHFSISQISLNKSKSLFGPCLLLFQKFCPFSCYHPVETVSCGMALGVLNFSFEKRNDMVRPMFQEGNFSLGLRYSL